MNKWPDWVFATIFIVAVVLFIAFWGTVGYVALHFITKFW